MKGSDLIVEFLIHKGIKHVFGYPGGMVTHLMDSFDRYNDRIKAHVCYHEQAAALEACAYAQASGEIGMAYATSGPGATNLITGICNAYFDSIPVLFITGQVNTNEAKGAYKVRQRGFQETDIVSMVAGVTNYAAYVDKTENLLTFLETAYQKAMTGRNGPVLLDIPMNIQRMECDEPVWSDAMHPVEESVIWNPSELEPLKTAKRPCILAGAALKSTRGRELLENISQKLKIPVVTSMIAVDVLSDANPYNYGFVGAYGDRTANFIAAKADVILTLGARLDVRQVGGKRENFAPDAQIIRVDIDPGELEYQIRADETDICADVIDVLEYIVEHTDEFGIDTDAWIEVCNTIKQKLTGIDQQRVNGFVHAISKCVPENTVITTDVGQNQVWTAQSFEKKDGQQILFSGGHGAMGYSLPAAIGAYYTNNKPVVSFNGDGGFQMNIQELEFIARERLPIKVVVFNNHSLGMIRHFQEMYFESNYAQTVEGHGYGVPDLEKIASAYEMKYYKFSKVDEITPDFMTTQEPVLVEINIEEDTYVLPKLRFGEPNQDQEPLIDRKLYQELMEL